MQEYNNDSLVKYLIFIKRLYSKDIIEAFYSINRADFVPSNSKIEAFDDIPLSIGFGQTISQPQVVSFMLELLNIKKGDKVLDIGSGSAYTTALLSQIVGKDGFVTGVERVEALIDYGKQNLQKYDIKNAIIVKASDSLGIENGHFDRILVSATSEYFPQELLKQLNVGGTLVIPIRSSIFLIKKEERGIKEFEYPGFSFVPLIYEQN